MSDLPRISVIIVTYRSRSLIDRCLAPFINRPDLEIIVWDNASGDGIGDHVRATYPDVRMIESPDNLGFARGNNRAIERCSGAYVLLLNPDAFIDDAATVDRLADHLDACAEVAACGPQLLNADGSHQVGDAGWRIGLASVFVHCFLLQRLLRSMRGLYLTNAGLLDRDQVDVDWVCGACMMVRRSAIEDVGGMDESVFMYGEDIEWGARMRAAGWLIRYLPRLTVLHLQGATQRSEHQLFSSTKWMEDVASRYAADGGAFGYAALKATLFAGYGARAFVLSTAGLVLRRPAMREKGRIMAAYALHTFKLPRVER